MNLEALRVAVVRRPVGRRPPGPVPQLRAAPVAQQHLGALRVVAQHREHQRGAAELRQEEKEISKDQKATSLEGRGEEGTGVRQCEKKMEKWIRGLRPPLRASLMAGLSCSSPRFSTPCPQPSFPRVAGLVLYSMQ